MQICVSDDCLFHYFVSNGRLVCCCVDTFCDLWIDGDDLYMVCGRPLVGVRISWDEVIFDLVTSGMEDFIEATVIFISTEYRKSIANLLELRGSMPCFGIWLVWKSECLSFFLRMNILQTTCFHNCYGNLRGYCC